MKIRKLFLFLLVPLFIFTLVGCGNNPKGAIDENKLRQANENQRKEFIDEYNIDKLDKKTIFDMKGVLKLTTPKANVNVDFEGITDNDLNSQFKFSLTGKDSTNFEIESNITLTKQGKDKVFVSATSRQKDGTYYEFYRKIKNPGNNLLPNPGDVLNELGKTNFAELVKQLGNAIEFLKDDNNSNITYIKLKYEALNKLAGGKASGIDPNSYAIIGIKKTDNNQFHFSSAMIKMTMTMKDSGIKMEVNYEIKETTKAVPTISESDQKSYSEINSFMDFYNKLPFKLLG